MDQDTRNKLQRATQQIRRLLEDEFAEQLEGTFDILQSGTILPDAGKHLDAKQRLTRQKLVDAIEHIKAGGIKPADAVTQYTREAAFTFLNRFVALRMLEARKLLQECVSKGDQSSGFKEFCGLAPGLTSYSDGGYQLYLECLFDELSVEVKVLFDRRDPASLLWPRRTALSEVLDILGQSDLASVWEEDETIGWVYQYFNTGDEREAMRVESPKAPRNSRELAVRNQFFTPRYVVEFLTDNTLGRIWYEMRKGHTRLVEQCKFLVRHRRQKLGNEAPLQPTSDFATNQSSKEVLEQATCATQHPTKDPRDLKVLDPACGSGHFLLYAFEVLITIYDEAWHDEDSPASRVTGRSLREDYTDLEQLHNALPGLVLAHNLYGIDIDPRAAQIAALALWMRAQRAFHALGIPREHRLSITRSNIVCSEPMPGEASFLDEFINEQMSGDAELRFLGSLVRKVFEVMKLAGEAGSLLRVEEDIAEDVAKAKKQWLERPEYTQQGLFDDGPRSTQRVLDLTHGIEDEYFWEEAEKRIYDALRNYSEQAEQSGGFQRSLFATDAARGFAFIDTFRQTYDVVLMNPPYGAPSTPSRHYLKTVYPDTYKDIYSAFVVRGLDLVDDYGLVGAITSKTFQNLTSFTSFREKANSHLDCLLDLGHGVLDGATVSTSAYVLNGNADSPSHMSFIRVDDVPALSRERVVFDEIRKPSDRFYRLRRGSFDRLPGKLINYALTQNVYLAFSTKQPLSEYLTPAVGLQTGDDFRFIRSWVEVKCSTKQSGWPLAPSGGRPARFHRNLTDVVNWKNDALEMKGYYDDLGRAGKSVRGNGPHRDFKYNFVPGFTFLYTSSTYFSCQPLPADSIITIAAQGIFSDDATEMLDEHEFFYWLGVLNSWPTLCLFRVINPGRFFQCGYVGKAATVLPEESGHATSISDMAKSAAITKRWFDSLNETSRSFRGPLALLFIDDKHASRRAAEFLKSKNHDFMAAQSKIDEMVMDDLGLNVEDARSLEQVFGYRSPVPLWFEDNKTPVHKCLFQDLISFCIGRVFGRWSVHDVTKDERDGSTNAMLSPVPATSPAMQGCEPKTSVISDDPGHPNDVCSAVEAELAKVCGESLSEVIEQIETELGDSIRNWIRKNLFEFHLGRYSGTRRTAPVYWQLATLSARYSVWIYYHQLSRDSLFQVLNEYVKPKLGQEQHKLNRLRNEAGPEPNGSQRAEIEDQEKFLTELGTMVEELERVAPLWNPVLDDGVIINFAPLWRLIPNNKSWQTNCKSCWDKLVRGDYDWAHFAMYLWPERVIEKCMTDASLAIAHGLEEEFWVQDERDRFQRKDEPEGGWESIVARLVKERTSPAVKAALKSLLDAPAPAGTSSKKRRRKKAGA